MDKDLEYSGLDLAVINSLKEGKKRWKELVDRLVNSGQMSRSTLSSHLKDLEDEDVIRRVPGRTEKDRNITYYELIELSLGNKINEAMTILRRKYLRDPTVEEIACFVGEASEIVSRIVHKLARKINWSPPTDDLIEVKRREVAYLLEFIAMKTVPGFTPRHEYEKEISLEEAKEYGKRFPDLVPKVLPQSAGRYLLEWSEEAMKIVGLHARITGYPIFWQLHDQRRQSGQERLVEAMRKLTQQLELAPTRNLVRHMEELNRRMQELTQEIRELRSNMRR